MGSWDLLYDTLPIFSYQEASASDSQVHTLRYDGTLEVIGHSRDGKLRPGYIETPSGIDDEGQFIVETERKQML
jgi:hypothetical protein